VTIATSKSRRYNGIPGSSRSHHVHNTWHAINNHNILYFLDCVAIVTYPTCSHHVVVLEWTAKSSMNLIRMTSFPPLTPMDATTSGTTLSCDRTSRQFTWGASTPVHPSQWWITGQQSAIQSPRRPSWTRSESVRTALPSGDIALNLSGTLQSSLQWLHVECCYSTPRIVPLRNIPHCTPFLQISTSICCSFVLQ